MIRKRQKQREKRRKLLQKNKLQRKRREEQEAEKRTWEEKKKKLEDSIREIQEEIKNENESLMAAVSRGKRLKEPDDGKFLGTFWPLVWDFFRNLDFWTILTKIGAVLRINMITTNGLGLFVFLTKTLSKCSGVT